MSVVPQVRSIETVGVVAYVTMVVVPQVLSIKIIGVVAEVTMRGGFTHILNKTGRGWGILAKRSGSLQIAFIGWITPETKFLADLGPHVNFKSVDEAVLPIIEHLTTTKGITRIVGLSHTGALFLLVPPVPPTLAHLSSTCTRPRGRGPTRHVIVARASGGRFGFDMGLKVVDMVALGVEFDKGALKGVYDMGMKGV